jgi:hypothetical protein
MIGAMFVQHLHGFSRTALLLSAVGATLLALAAGGPVAV